MKRSLSIILFSLLGGLCYPAEQQTFTVTGRVVDYQGRPVEGASVACYYFDLGFRHAGRDAFELLGLTKTTPDGQFRLEVKEKMPRKPLIVARKQGLAFGWKMALVPGTTVVLGRPHRLAGVVVDESGSPVCDATVRIYLRHWVFAWWPGDMSRPFWFIVEEIGPVVPEDWFTIKTDSTGRFAFEHIPPGATADFQVQAAGRALSYTFREGFGRAEQFAAGQTDIRIVLKPEATIQGRVIDEDTARPVPGLSLLVKADTGPYVHDEPVVSDAQARFEIKGLPAGTYILQFQYQDGALPNWVGKDTKVSVQDGQTVRDVEVPVGKGSILEVLVTDSDGCIPLEGTTVRVEHESDACSSCKYALLTDANGVARFRIPPGQCRIWGVKEGLGCTPNPESVSLDKGQHLQYTIGSFSMAAVNVSGTVLDSQGRVVEGASVIRGGAADLTDRNGRFEFSYFTDPIPSGTDLLVRDESTGQMALAKLRDPSRSGRIHGDITLQPGATLIGRVTDPNDRAVPAAYVRLLKTYDTRFITEVTTDAQGSYRILALPAFDEPMSLVVRVEGYGPAEALCPALRGSSGEVVHVDTIVLEPANESVRGVVVDANDKPVPQAVLHVSGREGKATGQPRRAVATDAQGRFRIDDLCKGPLRVDVSDGYLDAYGGAEDLRVVLGRQLVHTSHRSLVGKPLQDLADVAVDLSADEAKDKAILVCFFDMNQRPSRHCVTQLAGKAARLKEKGVTLVAVQAGQASENAVSEWIKKYNIPFSVRAVTADIEKTRLAWGVHSLPWLILTDRQHVVREEGFGLDELSQKIEAIVEKED